MGAPRHWGWRAGSNGRAGLFPPPALGERRHRSLNLSLCVNDIFREMVARSINPLTRGGFRRGVDCMNSALAENGYVIVRGFLEPGEIAALQGLAARAYAAVDVGQGPEFLVNNARTQGGALPCLPWEGRLRRF